MFYCRTSNNEVPEETQITTELNEEFMETVEVQPSAHISNFHQVEHFSVVDKVKDDAFFEVCFINKI